MFHRLEFSRARVMSQTLPLVRLSNLIDAFHPLLKINEEEVVSNDISRTNPSPH